MDIFADFAARVAAALKTLYPEASAELIARAVVEPPRDAGHGDLSSNAAMVVAKPLGKNPREIATALAEHFKSDPDVESVEVAGPGFLNFRLDEPVWHRVLKSVDELGEAYGKSDLGKGDKVNVEYVSANPTGPDACGPYARRGVRRRAGLAACLCRLRRDARVLHQRCRRAGRRPRAVGVPALPRGARRDRSRSRRASIPATT